MEYSAVIGQAENDLVELRVNIRWHKLQLDVIKQAADRLGMPYQTYIHQAAFRQAITDLKETKPIIVARRSRARRA